MLIYWFLKVFSRHSEPQGVRTWVAWSILYTFSKYEPADISYSLKHTHIHTQSDRCTQTELWELCCVFIAWTSVSMDSCIPLLLHTSFHWCYHCIPYSTDVSLGLQCHFIYDMMWSLKNKVICCTETEIVFFFSSFFSAQFSAQSPWSGEEHMHSAWLPSCTILK